MARMSVEAFNPNEVAKVVNFSKADFARTLKALDVELPWRQTLCLRRGISNAFKVYAFFSVWQHEPTLRLQKEKMARIRDAATNLLEELGRDRGAMHPLVRSRLVSRAALYAERHGPFSDMPQPKPINVDGIEGTYWHQYEKLERIIEGIGLLRTWAEEAAFAPPNQTSKHGGKRNTGEPQIDALLIELADAYRNALNREPGENAVFLDFLRTCTRPVLPLTKCTNDALRQRWRRVRKYKSSLDLDLI